VSGDALDAENAVEVSRGASLTLELSVVDEDDAVQDLTGARVLFTVKLNVQPGLAPLMQKDSTDITQIELVAPRLGMVRIYLGPSDTRLVPRAYLFDVWVILATGRRYAVIRQAPLRVLPSLTEVP
jgi:hypothetical protein